jgi:sugar (pentulose or hexulose) kinase
MRLLGRAEFSIDDVDDAVAQVPPGSDGLCFWPLLAAGAASAEGVRGGRLAGIGFGHGANHLVRAVLEGLGCELSRYVGLCERGGLTIDRLVLSGSAASSRATPQIVAQLSGRSVLCSTRSAASAWGAAVLARAMTEPASNLADLALAWSPDTRTVPVGDRPAVYGELLERYLEPFSAGRSAR